jgi:Protein of unknown function (DUF2459)
MGPRHGGMGLAGAVLAAELLALAGCAGPPPPSGPVATCRGGLALTVVAGGWHTGIGVPASLLEGRLAALRRADPGAGAFGFGFGQRDYYMAANPGLGDLLRATVPGPAVLLVTPLRYGWAPGERVWHLCAPAGGAAGLARFLAASFAAGGDGAPVPVGPGPCAGCVFYAAAERYDLAHTCNWWTAEALRAAGVKVRAAGVVTAGDLFGQLER